MTSLAPSQSFTKGESITSAEATGETRKVAVRTNLRECVAVTCKTDQNAEYVSKIRTSKWGEEMLDFGSSAYEQRLGPGLMV